MDRPLPDWEVVEKELRRRGVTMKLLWLEHLSQHPDGYRYTQFCRHFHAWQRASRPPVMRRVHRAGETLEVDYAGMTLTVIDAGVPREAQVFVACLPCSDLTYAEATWSQGHEDWLAAHVRAFAFIGGVPAKLVPDNLKSGVTDASYYDPVLNRSYHELARHYEVAVVPARVRKPRDKPSVEGGVGLVEQWVLAPLRHRQFFSLAEANVAIVEKITEWNDRPFAPPREGCRRSLFEAIERAALKPLPAEPFIIGQWLSPRVNVDYHVAVDHHFYSVPHRLVHKKVDVFLTVTAVTVSTKATVSPATRGAWPRLTTPRCTSTCRRRIKRWPGAHRIGCATTPRPSAWRSAAMSTGCSTVASTSSRACAPAWVSCGWPGATAGPARACL